MGAKAQAILLIIVSVPSVNTLTKQKRQKKKTPQYYFDTSFDLAIILKEVWR